MKHAFLLLPLLVTTAFADIIIKLDDRILAADQRKQKTTCFQLFNHLDTTNNRNGNLAFSPFSTTIAMKMALLGANHEGETALEIVRAFPPSISLEAMKRDELLVANATFCHEATTFNPDFIRSLKTFHHASAKTLDFVQPEPARATINAWVAEQTHDKIQNLMPPGSLTRDSRLVLVNALYFKDDWKTPFQPHNIRDRAFNTASGAAREIPFMHQTARFNYAEIDNIQILQLPYKNGCVMSLYLPREKDLAPAFALLDKDFSSDLKPARVSVALPKFTIQWQGSLKASLQQLGIREAFTENADFSRITKDERLFISDVFQAVFIAVDERGTEAAAATGVGFSVTSINLEQPVEFIADHPFLFTLATPDGTLLFTGVFRE